MAFQISDSFRHQYSDVLNHLYEQATHELAGTYRQEDQAGDMKFWDYYGPTSILWDMPGKSATPDIDVPNSRRANVLHTASWGKTIEDDDVVKQLIDPTAAYNTEAVRAFMRAKDERILQGLWLTALTGQNGTTPIAPTAECYTIEGDGSIIAPGGTVADTTETGLTLLKIATAAKIMDNNNVPKEDRVLVANFAQKHYLLGSTKVTNSDYAAVKALVGGQINEFYGMQFKWLPDDRFSTSSEDAGCFDCFLYHKASILMGVNKDFSSQMQQDPGIRFRTRIYAEARYGATRMQGGGVVRLMLQQNPALDFTQA